MSAAALVYPAINFAIADVVHNTASGNLQSMLFSEGEAAYLAGYLAGLVTVSGVVGAVLGPDIGPVIRFANGFANGAEDACALLGKPCIAIHKCQASPTIPSPTCTCATCRHATYTSHMYLQNSTRQNATHSLCAPRRQ
eukprot:2697989-Prymnesium_polylepis.1